MSLSSQLTRASESVQTMNCQPHLNVHQLPQIFLYMLKYIISLLNFTELNTYDKSLVTVRRQALNQSKELRSYACILKFSRIYIFFIFNPR